MSPENPEDYVPIIAREVQVPRYESIDRCILFSETPNREAAFALELIDRWGLVAGKDNGEDSAGRARVGYLSVEDTVQRAFNMSQAAFAEARRRGWLIPTTMPLVEVTSDSDDEDAEKTA